MNNVTKARGGYFTRGQLAAESGCNIETIRYYEQIGLMPEPHRSSVGHRLYGQEEAKRLNFIRRCRELGFNQEEIRGLLELVDSDDFTCAEVRALTSEHLSDVQERIKDLRRLERVLKKMIAECVGRKVPECAIIDALFQRR